IGGMGKAAQVHGFQEACSEAVEVAYRDAGICHVIRAGGLLLLKLIALDDRPFHRANDVDDISLFLVRAYSLFLEDIQDHHWDILLEYEIDDHYDLQVGGHYMGRMIRKTAGDNPSLTQRLATILQGHEAAGPADALQRALIRQHQLTEEQAMICLQAALKGFTPATP
ncbi:MAG: hypothetical protein AAF399_19700, partial [Bacteroidota bacterium]